MAKIKNNNKALAYKKRSQLIKTGKINQVTISARGERFKKLQESRKVVAQRNPTVKKIPQSPLNLNAKKELYTTVKNLIVNYAPNEQPHVCSLSRDDYYLNLFVLCCVDGIHDTNNENRFKSVFPGKTNFATTAPNFFRAVGDEIYKEFRNSYNNNDDSIDSETAGFFENISSTSAPF